MSTHAPRHAVRAARAAEHTWTDRAGPHTTRIEGPTTVGSAASVGVVIDDPSVSRLHVELDPRDDGGPDLPLRPSRTC